MFQKWINDKVFGNILKGSVVVLDRATYHMTLTEDSKPATSNLSKQELAEWLFQRKIRAKKYKSIEAFMALKKVELAAMCNKNEPKSKNKIFELEKSIKSRFSFSLFHILNSIPLNWCGPS